MNAISSSHNQLQEHSFSSSTFQITMSDNEVSLSTIESHEQGDETQDRELLSDMDESLSMNESHEQEDDLQDQEDLDPPPTACKTGIKARLDQAVKQMKRVNRSSDLVPLNHEYEVMKKELRILLNLTKTYKASMLSMDKARTEVCCESIETSSPSILLPMIANTFLFSFFSMLHHRWS